MSDTTTEAPEKAKVSPQEKARQDVCAHFQIKTEELEALKVQIGKIEAIWIGGRPFVYRSLKRVELKAIRESIKGGDESTYEELVASRCCVLPRVSVDELKTDDAGLASTLSDAISQFSGYAPDALPVKL